MNDPTRPRTDDAGRQSAQETGRFDEVFRAWASRPPATPAHRAGRRIAERVPARTRFPEIRRLAVAAALLAVVGLAAVLRWTGAPTEELVGSTQDVASVLPGTGAAVAPGGDVLVIDLDPETPLYLNLAGTDRLDQN